MLAVPCSCDRYLRREFAAQGSGLRSHIGGRGSWRSRCNHRVLTTRPMLRATPRQVATSLEATVSQGPRQAADVLLAQPPFLLTAQRQHLKGRGETQEKGRKLAGFDAMLGWKSAVPLHPGHTRV